MLRINSFYYLVRINYARCSMVDRANGYNCILVLNFLVLQWKTWTEFHILLGILLWSDATHCSILLVSVQCSILLVYCKSQLNHSPDNVSVSMQIMLVCIVSILIAMFLMEDLTMKYPPGHALHHICIHK